MTSPTIGQQLDVSLANLATKQDFEYFATKEDLKNLAAREELYSVVRAAVQELVQVINRNDEELREDSNRAGIPVRTKARGSYSAE
jgi:rRNA-processing protein FCF1